MTPQSHCIERQYALVPGIQELLVILAGPRTLTLTPPFVETRQFARCRVTFAPSDRGVESSVTSPLMALERLGSHQPTMQ